MGIGYKLSGCSAAATSAAPQSFNPDPKNYRVRTITKVGNYIIAQVIYPTCKGYEKNKVLVYEARDYDYLKRCSVALPGDRPPLDPHFCDSEEHPSPVARFRPGIEGLGMARTFCRNH